VIRKVYPIRADQVALFRSRFESMGVDYSNEKGNVRDTVVGLNREVYFIRSAAKALQAAAALWLLAVSLW